MEGQAAGSSITDKMDEFSGNWNKTSQTAGSSDYYEKGSFAKLKDSLMTIHGEVGREAISSGNAYRADAVYDSSKMTLKVTTSYKEALIFGSYKPFMGVEMTCKKVAN